MSSSVLARTYPSPGSKGARDPAAPGQPVDDVVGDPIAFLLADLQIPREGGMLGVVDEQVAKQQAAALHVAPRLLDEPHQLGVEGAAQEAHLRENIDRRTDAGALSRFFHR